MVKSTERVPAPEQPRTLEEVTARTQEQLTPVALNGALQFARVYENNPGLLERRFDKTADRTLKDLSNLAALNKIAFNELDSSANHPDIGTYKDILRGMAKPPITGPGAMTKADYRYLRGSIGEPKEDGKPGDISIYLDVEQCRSDLAVLNNLVALKDSPNESWKDLALKAADAKTRLEAMMRADTYTVIRQRYEELQNDPNAQKLNQMGRFITFAGIALIGAITGAQMLLRMKKDGLKGISLTPFAYAAVALCVANPGLIKTMYKDQDQRTMENAVVGIKSIQSVREDIKLNDADLYALTQGLGGMEKTERATMLKDIQSKKPSPETLAQLTMFIDPAKTRTDAVKASLEEMNTNDSLRTVVNVMDAAGDDEKEVIRVYLDSKKKA